MPTVSELARTLPAGPELDALFFETCCGWRFGVWYDGGWHDDPGGWYVGEKKVWNFPTPPEVTADANACEAAMRWARENGFIWKIERAIDSLGEMNWVRLTRHWKRGGFCEADGFGDDWKHAFVRACIIAKEAIDNRTERKTQ